MYKWCSYCLITLALYPRLITVNKYNFTSNVMNEYFLSIFHKILNPTYITVFQRKALLSNNKHNLILHTRKSASTRVIIAPTRLDNSVTPM